MSLDPSSFHDVMARLRAGDDRAADQVFRRYAHRLIALARGRLSGPLRKKVDPEDVLQSVFRSFYCRYTDGKYEVENWDSLWRLLAVITVRKCGRQVERFFSQRRDCRLEAPAADDSDSCPEGGDPADDEPTPAEAAMLAETVELLLRDLQERERPILVLMLQGYAIPEISAEVGRSERTVYRILEKVRQILERMQSD